MPFTQMLATHGGVASSALGLICSALVGVLLLQQTQQSWEPLLQNNLPALRIFSHVDTIWTLHSKGLRSGILMIGPATPGAAGALKATPGEEALPSTTSFTLSAPEGETEFPTVTPLEMQGSNGSAKAELMRQPEPAPVKEVQEKEQGQGQQQQQQVQEANHQSEVEGHEQEQQQRQQQQQQQNEGQQQQGEQAQQQSEQGQSEQQSEGAKQGSEQAEQQHTNQQQESDQQNQTEQQQQQQEQQQAVEAQGQDEGHAGTQTDTGDRGPTQQGPGGSGEDKGGEGGHPSCPGCDLLRLLRYNKPLNETPPDEPLKYFRDIPPSPTPLVLNSSSRFYVLEAKPDRCAGVMHKRFALKCAVAEALALNRQLAVHMTACLSRVHTERAQDQWLPFSTYLDLDIISRDNHVDIVYAEQVAEAMMHAQAEGRGEGLSIKTFDKHFPVQRLRDEEGDTTVVVRKPLFWENGFDICFDPSSKELADHMNPTDLTYNRHLVEIGDKIIQTLGGFHNYVTVHVRRGDKAQQTYKWPHVDQDTRPESLRKKLPRFVDPGSVLYIATNEDTPGFFDPLKDLYTIYMLEDFAHLWGPNSTWFDEFRRLLKTDNPEFDVYMKGIVDDHIGMYAKKTVETFNDLTDDPRNGIDAPP